MLSCGAFLYVAAGPLLSQLEPQHVATLPLGRCGACLLLDRIESDAASRRLAKEANQKSAARLALEEPHATAALLSLAGARTVLANQWSVSAASNTEMLLGLLLQLGQGATLAAALASCARSALIVQPPPASAPGTPAPPEQPPTNPVEFLWGVIANPVVYGLPSFQLS